MKKLETNTEEKSNAFYMIECNKRGIRIYPVTFYNNYVLEIEFNKTNAFEKFSQTKIIRGETKYDKKGKEWVEVIFEKYKQIYEKRILPRINKGKKVNAGTIRPIYKKAN